MEPSFLHDRLMETAAHPLQTRWGGFLTVIEGALLIWIGEQKYELALGDTIYYPCAILHRWQNPSALPATLLAVSTPRPIRS